MLGLDVSNNQGNIDWAKVKASGKDFVIIRAGWGKTNTDPKFKQYIESAIKNGFKYIGIYYFLYARSENDIIKNAIKCDSIISPYKDKINFKVWADWEYDSDNYCKGLSKATRTQWVKAFCNKLKGMGYDVGIYANPDYINNKFNDISEYPLWLAYYTTNKNLALKYKPLIWQSTSKGSVNGINGNVDLDELFGEVKVEQPKETTPITTTTTYTKHTVKKGEYLSTIASKYKVTVDEIMAVNPQIKNKNLINIGQVINIPTKTTTVAVNKNPYKEPIFVQQFGSRGEGVKWVQWALNQRGYGLVLDGEFGTNTRNAVLDFQVKNGLKNDGKVGNQTRKKLK